MSAAARAAVDGLGGASASLAPPKMGAPGVGCSPPPPRPVSCPRAVDLWRQGTGRGEGTGQALGVQSRRRRWAGLSFFRPAGERAVEGVRGFAGVGAGRGPGGGGGGCFWWLGPVGGGGGGLNGSPPVYWSPTGVQPTACTLALWWLRFGP